jgi:hypothetical protein
MSDSDIELGYEQDLQADTRYLEIWVTFLSGERRKVRTFVDTPVGRQVAAKKADEQFALPAVNRVEVVPVRGTPGRKEGPGIAGTKARERAASSERATCEYGRRLCEVRMVPKPSGRRLVHGDECPDRPGEVISTREYAQGRTWPPRGMVRR